ncbi:MAG: protein kinase, partial [Bacteroidota bacterium]
MHTHAFKAGQKLRNGAYEIIKVLGQGGFGITYLARFSSLDRMVAIKEFFISGYCVRNTTGADITPQSMAEEEYTSYKKKFIAEAKTLAKFAHPAIVPVSDIFEENNTAYFVMNYIEGASLADMIQQMGPIPSQDAQGYIRQAAEALEVVHGRNVLHRDIKPDNIMVRPNGRVVLIDFGTARAFVDSKTVTHTTLLTPGFAPLEQYSDRQQRGVYTDIYALGATLYNCLTGKIPPPAVDRLQKAELPDLPEGPLGEVIAKAMAMQTEARYQSIADFLTDLNQTEEPLQAEGVDEPVEAQTILSSGEATEILATPEPVTSTETSSTPSTSSSVSRTLIRILVPLLGMALLAVGGWWGWKYKLQQEQSDQKVQYQAAMVKAEAAMAQNDWEAAITSYQEALTHQDTPEAREQLRKAQSTLKAQADQEAERQRNFSQYLQKGDALFAEKEYNLAQFNYELARKYAHPDSL